MLEVRIKLMDKDQTAGITSNCTYTYTYTYTCTCTCTRFMHYALEYAYLMQVKRR